MLFACWHDGDQSQEESQCEDRSVTGRLDPYEDPDTGERLFTTFEGRLEGKTFHGTFLTLFSASGQRVGGTWSVARKTE